MKKDIIENPEWVKSLPSGVHKEENKGGHIRILYHNFWRRHTPIFKQKKFAVYLRFAIFQNCHPVIHETFFDSLQIHGCPTGQVIDTNILSL